MRTLISVVFALASALLAAGCTSRAGSAPAASAEKKSFYDWPAQTGDKQVTLANVGDTIPVFTFILDPGKTVSGVLTHTNPSKQLSVGVGVNGRTIANWNSHYSGPGGVTICNSNNPALCTMTDWLNPPGSKAAAISALVRIANELQGNANWHDGHVKVLERELDPNTGKLASAKLGFVVEGPTTGSNTGIVDGSNLLLTVH